MNTTDNTTLVTAIYDNDYNSLIGGRGRGIHHYDSSLRNISNLNLPIIIYVDKKDFEMVDSVISQYMQNYKLIVYDLQQFEYSNQFLEFKKTIMRNIILNDRNEILCYNKAYWVMDAIEKNYFKTNKFLWIDSGLTHHGIIPEKVGGVELLIKIQKNHYYPINQNNIFSPKLGSNINNIIKKDKLLFCALPFQGNSEKLHYIAEKFYNKTNLPIITNHLVGGIFGGYSEKFIKFFNEYRTIIKLFIDEKIHVLEEQIFSSMYIANPDLFDLKKFTTWYFYSPGERTSMLDKDGDSFYKIFTKIYE